MAPKCQQLATKIWGNPKVSTFVNVCQRMHSDFNL